MTFVIPHAPLSPSSVRQHRRHPRGFSLIEMMAVVTILGVIATVGVPLFEPMTRRQKVDGALDAVTAFVARARALAVTSGRCVRVRLATTIPARLVAEQLNIYDCLDSTSDPVATPRIDGSTAILSTLWLPAFEMKLDERGIEVSFTDGTNDYQPIVTYPHAGWNVPAPGPNGAALIYRPTGRLWSDHNPALTLGDPANIYNDDGVLVVRAASAPTELAYMVATSHGPICTIKLGRPLVGTAGDYTCP